MENSLEYEYAVIGNDNDSVKTWIYKPYNITDSTFTTRTKCGKDKDEHYSFH